jgi:sec-independent protein translocase protein TatB
MSFGETIFLFVLALIVFGPKKLPEIARQVGRYLAEFRRASNEFKAQIEQEISHLEAQERQKILPPSRPPEGATSRSLKPEASGPVESVAEAPASAATTAEPAPAGSSDASTPATEAIPAADPVAASASQESHA